MTEEYINQFQSYLRNEEKAEATISKYLHDVKEMLVFIENMDLNKESLIEYRKHLSIPAQLLHGMVYIAPVQVSSTFCPKNAAMFYV